MTLINGPYNGRTIADLGTVATYEPSADRSLAFWMDNVWAGPIVAIVD